MLSYQDICKALSCFERNDDPTIQMDAPMNRQVLFIAKKMNWGCHAETDWQDSTWLVFRDGTVYYQQCPDNEPSLRTITIIIDALDSCGVRYDSNTIVQLVHELYRHAAWTPAAMSADDFQQLLTLLNGPFKSSKARMDCCDGEGWRMVCYDRYPIHSIEGYIYGLEPLERIAEILSRNVNCLRIHDIVMAIESAQS